MQTTPIASRDSLGVALPAPQSPTRDMLAAAISENELASDREEQPTARDAGFLARPVPRTGRTARPARALGRRGALGRRPTGRCTSDLGATGPRCVVDTASGPAVETAPATRCRFTSSAGRQYATAGTGARQPRGPLADADG